jgi:hypothetical protein
VFCLEKYLPGTGSGPVRSGYTVVGSGSGPDTEKNHRVGSGYKKSYPCRTLVLLSMYFHIVQFFFDLFLSCTELSNLLKNWTINLINLIKLIIFFLLLYLFLQGSPLFYMFEDFECFKIWKEKYFFKLYEENIWIKYLIRVIEIDYNREQVEERENNRQRMTAWFSVSIKYRWLSKYNLEE